MSAAEGIVLHGTKIRSDEIPGDNRVVQRGLTPDRWQPQEPDLARKSSWSLPARALSEGAQVSKRVLVLRFNFRPDSPDDSSRTTGNGRMDLSNPLAHDSTDYDSEYYRRVGHLVDPPPHDSAYFDAHLRALSRYYETVSEGKIELDWDVYPPKKDSVYVLPHPMSYYGKCEFDSVVFGLTRYFVDCIRVADSTSPEILFSNYESVFLFHAGSDRQNDLGFPETCADLFTGFIRYFPQPSEGFDTAWVDNRTSFVQTALIMPEAASQDNRATALNAVLAHEFGHQLGLVDLYATNTFMSQLGDFALMDNNGFGTGIDFDYEVGRVFGAIPLFPEAWSRAYLGYVDVYDYRQGSDVRVVAAEAVSSGIKIARVPVSENEYYLIENRLVDTDRRTTAMLVDSLTYVFQGPVDSATRAFTGEYDFLLPGSGLLIFHVDEGVAGLDYDGDGVSNFDDNDLQWDWDRRFIRLIEADGLINFGGYYRSGYGREEDMFRDDRNQAFTPNTNPRTFDNSGNNTHVHITNIARDTAIVGGLPRLLDTVMLFNVATDGLADGFPVRAGFPRYGLSPIADDIDKDGTPEIIAASGRNLLLFTTNGENFLHKVTACDPCSTYYDTATASVYPEPGRPHALPLYARMLDTISTITAGPVTGDFGFTDTQLVAVGYPISTDSGRVTMYQVRDGNRDGLADAFPDELITFGIPIALSFGDTLFVLADNGLIYAKPGLLDAFRRVDSLPAEQFHGICRVADKLLVMTGDSLQSLLYCIDGDPTDSIELGGYYNFGPIVVDVDRDDVPEVVAFGPDGHAIFVSIDTTSSPVSMSILRRRETDFHVTTNPVAADLDRDGYPDIVIGGTNAIYAFDRTLTLLTDFPMAAGDRFLDDDVIAAPVVADIDRGGPPEVVFPTLVGNVYSFGDDLSNGFPLSGGERAAGAAVILSDSSGGKLGYLGSDGWFYLWEVDKDTSTDYWPMGGHDAAGTFAFDQSRLSEPTPIAELLPDERFYNYPNPVTDGSTVIRYYLGEDAAGVRIKLFDLSGTRVAELHGATAGGLDHEQVWDCSHVTPGVYRCILEADFGGRTETAFTDIAVIR